MVLYQVQDLLFQQGRVVQRPQAQRRVGHGDDGLAEQAFRVLRPGGVFIAKREDPRRGEDNA